MAYISNILLLFVFDAVPELSATFHRQRIYDPAGYPVYFVISARSGRLLFIPVTQRNKPKCCIFRITLKCINLSGGKN